MIPIFLSVVMVMHDCASDLDAILTKASTLLGNLVTDYEIIVVDNGSSDDSLEKLKKLTLHDGLPNLQIFALTATVDRHVAFWTGIESALGDFVAVIDPTLDDLSFLPSMLDKSLAGTDLVFAYNRTPSYVTLSYRSAYATFDYLYRLFHGHSFAKDNPMFRILNKKAINFIAQQPQPAISFRHLNSLRGFSRLILEYDYKAKMITSHSVLGNFNLGIKILISTTKAPMRLATGLSLFGAIANLIYSLYVVLIAVFQTNVAPGWVSLSLQQSGMFFLISLVLWVLGEYIVNMANISNEGSGYYIGQEFMSTRMTQREKLNIDEGNPAPSQANIERNR